MKKHDPWTILTIISFSIVIRDKAKLKTELPIMKSLWLPMINLLNNKGYLNQE